MGSKGLQVWRLQHPHLMRARTARQTVAVHCEVVLASGQYLCTDPYAEGQPPKDAEESTLDLNVLGVLVWPVTSSGFAL
jgi:hypothetical protein